MSGLGFNAESLSPFAAPVSLQTGGMMKGRATHFTAVPLYKMKNVDATPIDKRRQHAGFATLRRCASLPLIAIRRLHDKLEAKMSNAAERKPSEWIRPIIITVIGAVTSASLGYYLATKRAPPAITITVLDSRGTKLDEVPVDGVKDKGNVTITLSKDVIKTIVNRETTSNMLTSSNIEKEEILHKNKNNQALVTSPHPDRPVEVKVTSKHPEQ